MKRAIVTGATGAIGMALIECLEKQGVEVIAIVRPDSVRADRIKESEYVKKVSLGLNELKRLPELVSGKADVFYHLGWDGTTGEARNNVELQNRNVLYALNAVEVADKMGCGRFIGAGSQAEYGRYEGKLNHTVPANPETGYGMGKLCAGHMTRLLCRQKGICHIWTRILSVYGPYDADNTLVTSVIRKLLNGDIPACTKAEQMWDYLYSKDAAKALSLLGLNGKDGKTYCIGSGKAEPLKNYIEIIRQYIDAGLSVDYGAIAYSDNQVMYLCADIEELQKDTGFEPEYTFLQGIEETVNWIKNN